MKKMNQRILVPTLLTVFVGLCFLGVSQSGAADDEKQTTIADKSSDSKWPKDEDDWRDDETDEEWEDGDEEDYDEEQELEWELAEQSLIAHSVELSADVAMDKVKTAVVAATLLLEHAEPAAAIDALLKAIEKADAPEIKRALRLKLIEAHLENDDSTSAINIATRLMVGE